ncbi:hypothetical protein BGX31_001026 [Mortierella sp. GBA43]|nr:hypothetical protein BGX31_001026 [Mortierella sp. GBA43]
MQLENENGDIYLKEEYRQVFFETNTEHKYPRFYAAHWELRSGYILRYGPIGIMRSHKDATNGVEHNLIAYMYYTFRFTPRNSVPKAGISCDLNNGPHLRTQR